MVKKNTEPFTLKEDGDEIVYEIVYEIVHDNTPKEELLRLVKMLEKEIESMTIALCRKIGFRIKLIRRHNET